MHLNTIPPLKASEQLFAIELNQLGKKFNGHWIFRNINLHLNKGDTLAVLGANGSGKSTLLQIIAGSLSPSEGSIHYFKNAAQTRIESDEIFRHLTICAPYLDLLEDFTLTEILQFHFRLKPLLQGLDLRTLIDIIGLSQSQNKPLQQFSSGMRQRVKLALAIFTDNPLLLLDEPTANLDHQAIQWYRNLIETYCKEKTIVVCSNRQLDEHWFCKQSLVIEDYKPLAGNVSAKRL